MARTWHWIIFLLLSTLVYGVKSNEVECHKPQPISPSYTALMRQTHAQLEIATIYITRVPRHQEIRQGMSDLADEFLKTTFGTALLIHHARELRIYWYLHSQPEEDMIYYSSNKPPLANEMRHFKSAVDDLEEQFSRLEKWSLSLEEVVRSSFYDLVDTKRQYGSKLDRESEKKLDDAIKNCLIILDLCADIRATTVWDSFNILGTTTEYLRWILSVDPSERHKEVRTLLDDYLEHISVSGSMNERMSITTKRVRGHVAKPKELYSSAPNSESFQSELVENPFCNPDHISQNEQRVCIPSVSGHGI